MEYIKCFEKGEEPVDYIFRLFETADIVILGERDHRDVTQYEFICKLISDPRFAQRVGYVYTEVGVTNMTQQANHLIKGTYACEDDYMRARMSFLRDEDYLFCWEKTNRSVFIDTLYSINKRLSDSSKITLGLTDVEFDWYKVKSPVWYRKWYYKYAVSNTKNIRDKIMAKNFIRQYKKQKPIGGRRKALLITNHPHAIDNETAKNEGYRIKRKFGAERVKIVCFNWLDALHTPSQRTLVDGGKWDAAFEITGCRPVAIDIRNTPFGKAKYNSRWTQSKKYRQKCYQEYMDGIIYDVPFYKFKASIGVPGFVNDSCKEEQKRRLELLYDAGIYSVSDYENNKTYYNTLRTFPCEDSETLHKMRNQTDTLIRKYLENQDNCKLR